MDEKIMRDRAATILTQQWHGQDTVELAENVLSLLDSLASLRAENEKLKTIERCDHLLQQCHVDRIAALVAANNKLARIALDSFDGGEEGTHNHPDLDRINELRSIGQPATGQEGK